MQLSISCIQNDKRRQGEGDVYRNVPGNFRSKNQQKGTGTFCHGGFAFC